jgi:hypothetical protein
VPAPGDSTGLPTLRAGEGMGVMVVVTGSPASRRVAEVRGGLSPDDTLVIVATMTPSAGRSDRFTVDATSDEAFLNNWGHLTGALSSGRRAVEPTAMDAGAVAPPSTVGTRS